MQVIFQHINDPVPDVLESRPDLPFAVANVLEKAMAKEPDARFETAGAFAEAFSAGLHQDQDSLADVQKAYPIDAASRQSRPPGQTIRLDKQAPANSQSGPGSQTIIVQQTNPLVLLGGFGLIALVIVIVAIVLIMNQSAPALTPTAAPTPPPTLPVAPVVDSMGDVFFSTIDAPGDTVTLSVNELDQPATGLQYVAWLMNTETDEWLVLGQLIVDSFGRGSLNYIDAEGRMLPIEYNALVITAEAEVDDTPDGDIVYNAQVVRAVSNALSEILVASENGIENSDGTFTSLLQGATIEATFARQHAGLAASSSNLGGLQTHSEHTINILNGTAEDYNGNGRGENPGRGIGLVFFLDTMDTVIGDAVTQEDTTTSLQVNAENIRVCLENVRLWTNELIQIETANFSAADMESVADEQIRATELADHIIIGFDANSDGRIDAFEGECGLEQIPGFALEASRMNLIEGSIN
jgi:hypothetical protein